MTQTPGMTSLRTTSDFLIIADMHVLNKITAAKEHGSSFTSETNLSISIKDSFERFIIPCLLGIRKTIEQASEISKEKNYDAKEAHDLLIFGIFTKSVQLQELKEKSIDPIVVAGLSLSQGICADVMEEIGPFIYKRT